MHGAGWDRPTEQIWEQGSGEEFVARQGGFLSGAERVANERGMG